MRNFETLFICGCPRSGTTAIWELLSTHPSIAIGLERYHCRIEEFSLSYEDFELPRFFDLQPGDTFYDDLAFTPYYAELRPRFEQTTHRGDKIPKLYERFDPLFHTFPDARVVVMFRNLIDVALSYSRRARDPQDPWLPAHTVRSAIRDWNVSLEQTLRFVWRRENVLCVDYETFFVAGQGLERLAEFLGLEDAEPLRAAHRRMVEYVNGELMGDRLVLDINFFERKELLLSGRFGLYRKIERYTE